MKLPKLEKLDLDKFFTDAFKKEIRAKLEEGARVRRNIYLWFFLTGIACIFIASLTNQTTVSILSLFLATLSLVVMTKYDTQLYFFSILKLMRTEEDEEEEP